MIDPVTAMSLGIKPGAVDPLKSSATGAVQSMKAEGAVSFADTLANMGTSTIDGLSKAEALSMDALRGNATTREVADAVMKAEQSLQVAIAVRDKVVTAYLEISRMSI